MTVLSLHIISGLLGLISGFIAVFSVKGMKLHRGSGMVFVYSMLTLAATGTVLGVVKNELSNATSGALTFYLVATALLTVRDRERKHYWLVLPRASAGVSEANPHFSVVGDSGASAAGSHDLLAGARVGWTANQRATTE
jgi:hypothetical protein